MSEELQARILHGLIRMPRKVSIGWLFRETGAANYVELRRALTPLLTTGVVTRGEHYFNGPGTLTVLYGLKDKSYPVPLHSRVTAALRRAQDPQSLGALFKKVHTQKYIDLMLTLEIMVDDGRIRAEEMRLAKMRRPLVLYSLPEKTTS